MMPVFMNRRFQLFYLAALVFVLSVVIALIFPDYLVGRPGDKFYWLYQFNFFADKVKEFSSPLVHTDTAFFPDGFNMGAGYENFLCFFFFFVFKLFFADNISYNLLVPTNLILVFLATYHLALHFKVRASAALTAATAFTFSNYILVQIASGQIHFASAGFIPLFFLYFFRFQEKPEPKNYLLMALSLFFVSLASWSWLMFIIVIFAIYLPVKLALKELGWKHISGIIRGGIFFSIIILPFIWPMLINIYNGEAVLHPIVKSGNYFYLADLLSFFTPQDNALVSNSFFRHLRKSFLALYPEEQATFLGFLSILFFLFYLFAVKHRGKRDIVLLTTIPFILSLGPILTVAGVQYVSVAGHTCSIPLPYRLIMDLPLFGFGRIPSRYVIFVALFTSLATGIVIEHLLLRFAAGKKFAAVFVGSIAVIVILERTLVPFPATRVTYHRLKEYFPQNEYEAIIAVPSGSVPINYLGQVVGKKVVGGRINHSARTKEIHGFLQLTPFVRDVSSKDYCSNNSLIGGDIFRQNISPDYVASLLKKNSVGHVILFDYLWKGEQECRLLYEYLSDLFQPLTPSYADDEMIIYDLSRFQEDVNTVYEYFMPDTKSFSRDVVDYGNGKMKTLGLKRSYVRLFSSPGPKRLSFTAASFKGKKLEVYFANDLIFEGRINSTFEQYTTREFSGGVQGDFMFVTDDCSQLTSGKNVCLVLGDVRLVR